jgi:hypothetical protein
MTTMTTALCPCSLTSGKRVSTTTLRALVRDEFRGQIADDADYLFCDAVDCDVVYFTTDGRTITKPQLKVEVGIKETVGDRPLCYCFGHSVATIKEELRTKGRSDALEDIRRKMQDSGCGCAVTNPSGSCCLGAVARGIETARAEVNGATPTSNKAETSEGCCAPGHACCAAAGPAGKRPFNGLALNKVMLWGVTLLAVLLLFFPKYMSFLAGGTGMKDLDAGSCEQATVPDVGNTDARPIDADRQIIFKVDGFT